MKLAKQPSLGLGGLCVPRRTAVKPTTFSAALPPAHQHQQHQPQQQHQQQQQHEQHKEGEHCLFSRQVTTAGLSGLAAATLLLVPGGSGAQPVALRLPAAGAGFKAASQALTSAVHAKQGSSSLAASLQGVASAPALVSISGEGLLEGVVGIVETGLGDLATSSMAPIGGPVTGEVLSATVPADDGGSASSSVPAASEAQQQRALDALWCRAWGAYCHALEASPLSTKVLTGIIGTGLGDAAAQALSHIQASPGGRRSSSSSSGSGTNSSMRFDSVRTARLCLYSAAIGTPMAHFWYALLDQAVMPNAPLAPVAVASKVALDQLVQTPLGMALFLGLMKLLEGQPGQVAGELRGKMLPALVANWRVWVPAQLVSFTLVPEDQRILYANLVGIAWTCIISNMQQQQQQQQQQQPAAAAGQTQQHEQQPDDWWAAEAGTAAHRLRRSSSSAALL